MNSSTERMTARRMTRTRTRTRMTCQRTRTTPPTTPCWLEATRTTQTSSHKEEVRTEPENDCPVSCQIPKLVTKSLCNAVGVALSSLCKSFKRRNDEANAPRFADDNDDQQRKLRRLAASVLEHRGTCRRRFDGG